LKIGVFEEMGSVLPKISDTGVVPTNHFSCQKTRMISLAWGIKIWAEVSFVLSQFTRLTDGQTDRHFAHG